MYFCSFFHTCSVYCGLFICFSSLCSFLSALVSASLNGVVVVMVIRVHSRDFLVVVFLGIHSSNIHTNLSFLAQGHGFAYKLSYLQKLMVFMFIFTDMHSNFECCA